MEINKNIVGFVVTHNSIMAHVNNPNMLIDRDVFMLKEYRRSN